MVTARATLTQFAERGKRVTISQPIIVKGASLQLLSPEEINPTFYAAYTKVSDLLTAGYIQYIIRKVTDNMKIPGVVILVILLRNTCDMIYLPYLTTKKG